MAPISGRSSGRRRGPFSLPDALPLDAIRTAAEDGPDGLVPLLLPIDTGLDAFPVVILTEVEVGAIARGQYVRPAAGVPGGADHYRLVGPSGGLVAIAGATGGRLGPEKVFVSPSPAEDPVVPAAPVA